MHTVETERRLHRPPIVGAGKKKYCIVKEVAALVNTEKCVIVAETARTKLAGRRVLIIVENLPVPPDRRVWQEAMALRDAGCQVTVICPKGEGYDQSHEIIDGIDVYRHPQPIEARRLVGYIVEYSVALFWELLLSARVACGKGFDVIHACNPPDLIFLIGVAYKFMGKRFVFDHHDLNPELFRVKFGRRRLSYRVLLLLERLTFATADVVISTNDSYRRIAIERGGMRPADVFVVRSAPRARDPLVRWDRCESEGRLTIGYIGVMGSQDGVDTLLRVARQLRDDGYEHVRFLLVGDGPELAGLKRLAIELRLDETVEFTGFVTGTRFESAIARMDIGICPDGFNDYNDKCTMNKIMEYMSFGIPVVQYDLTEGRVTAGDASLYARRNDEADLAAQLRRLIDDPILRTSLGEMGARRFKEQLDWQFEVPSLLAAYERLFAKKRWFP